MPAVHDPRGLVNRRASLQLFVRVTGLFAIALGVSSVALGMIQAGTPVAANIGGPWTYPAAAKPGTSELAWSTQINEPAATYIAIHFVDFDLAPGDYLLVSDAQGGQTYTLEGKGKMGRGTFWSQHIKGGAVLLQLMVSSATGGQGFRIDQYVTGFLDLGPAPGTAGSAAEGSASADTTIGEAATMGRSVQALCGIDDKRNAACFRDSHPLVYDRSRPVARLLINGSSLCTGWLVSPQNHLLTNEHCISSELDAVNTDYEFMAEAPNCEDINSPLGFRGTVVSGATFIQSNLDLDYALLQFTAASPVDTYGYLQVDNRTTAVGEQVFIPQHPGGRAKELALFSTDPHDPDGFCRVTSVSEPACTGSGGNLDLGYYADTEGGSSGSPVISMSSYKVIALHHCAVCPNRAVPINLICQDMPSGICLDSSGFVSLSRNSYGCQDVVSITAGDTDLMGSGTVTVAISSSVSGDHETVVLQENTAGSGVFVGTIGLMSAGSVAENGSLEVSLADVVTAAFQDASDNAGQPALATDSAQVDCAPPVVSDVQIVELGPFLATISFRTDEPATCALDYGPDCGSPAGEAAGSAWQTLHVIQLNDLAQQTRYHFSIRALDAAGNVLTADNGGSCFSFDTPGQPDEYYTEMFVNRAIDLQYKSILFIPDGSPNFYRACVQPITALPTDPTGGIPLSPGDDDPAEVFLPGSLYGVSYDEFFVGGNGYITFSMSDKAFVESLEGHFNLPRISAFFDDLNPTAGGTVSLKQLPDRVTVTWLDVPEYKATTKNTFQVELFADGRIQLSYLDIASTDGLVGLSAGFGVPGNFVVSDLSGEVCTAAPAITSAVSRKTHAGKVMDLDLLTPATGGCGIVVESRQGGPTEIVVTFDLPVQEAGISGGDVEVSSGAISELSIMNQQLTVKLVGVRNGEQLVMRFPGILGPVNTPVAASLCLAVLAGDVNGDCAVNVLDLTRVRLNMSLPVTTSNYLCDINTDGRMNVLDLAKIRINMGQSFAQTSCP